MSHTAINVYLTFCRFVKEVRCNCSSHRSAHLFIIAISSHSHIILKQSQRTFLQYSCSVTMINIVKRYLWMKIHELNTLIGLLMILSNKHRINIIPKIYCCRRTTGGCFHSFLKFSMHGFRFFRKLLHSNIFFTSFFLRVKVRKQNSRSDFGLHLGFLSWNACTFRSLFCMNS